MRTYYLLGRTSEEFPKCPFTAIIEDEIQKSQDLTTDSVNLTSAAPDTRSLYSPVTFEELARSVHSTKNNTPEGTPAKATLVSWHGSGNATRLTSEELLNIPMVASRTLEVDNQDYNNSPTKLPLSGFANGGTRLENSSERIHNELGMQNISKKVRESEKPRSQTCLIL